MSREGGCACGAIRFTIDGELLGTGACHCSNCQKFSGGGPNYVALVPKTALRVTKGEPSAFLDSADSGGTVTRVFCGTCGTPLWSTPEGMPFMTVKVGALDDYSELGPAMHIYTGSAPEWHHLPTDLPCFEKMPPMEATPGNDAG